LRENAPRGWFTRARRAAVGPWQTCCALHFRFAMLAVP
jgi:hypothetical protein